MQKTKHYYQTNGHGDVVALTDASGNQVNTYTYDIWGNPLTTQESIEQPFRYSGEFWDSSTGLQYLRARWYDPSVGRFINEDTYEGDITNPLSLNLYTYVHNNPLRYIDPTGHWCTSADGKWSGPGGCDGGILDEKVNRSVGTSFYIDDNNATNFSRQIVENGIAKGKWYPEGSVRFENDPTGISDAFIGCAYDSQCGGFVTGGIASAPSIYNGAKEGASKAWNWVRGLISGSNALKVGNEIEGLGVIVNSPGQTITSYSKHALERAAQRGVSEELMNSTVANARLVLDQTKTDTYLYLTTEAVVVLNRSGKAITAYGKSYFDETIQAIVKRLK